MSPPVCPASSTSSSASLSTSRPPVSATLLVLISCLLAVIMLPSCAAQVFTGYNVTWLNAPGQSLTMFTNPPSALTTPAQNPLGPFANSNYLISANDPPSLAGTWQSVIQLPWPFLFFGVNYTAITVTSKGFFYFGEYDYQTDLSNLESVAAAPDYSTSGAGFPSIGGTSRPVVSFWQSAEGGVPIYDLVNYGSLGCLLDGTVSQSGGGQCVLADYFWQVLPALTTTMVVTNVGPRKVLTSTYITPVNSVAKPSDGQRFVLTALDLRDGSGAQGQAVVVLYQSGLIEIAWYQVSLATATTQYTTPAVQSLASIGIQGLVSGTAVHYSTPANVLPGYGPAPSFSQQLFSTLASVIKQSILSFRPLFSS